MTPPRMRSFTADGHWTPSSKSFSLAFLPCLLFDFAIPSPQLTKMSQPRLKAPLLLQRLTISFFFSNGSVFPDPHLG